MREFIYTDAPYPQSHASTLVELTSGAVAAAWFRGTHERNPDVEIWFARRSPTGWEKSISVANGIQPDGQRLPTWNPVLFQDANGALQLFYKIGPNPRDWRGMVIRATDEDRSWSPLAPNPNSGTDAVTLKDGRQFIVYNHGAHRMEQPGKGPRWPLNIDLSDDCIHWRNAMTLENEPVPNGHAYPAVIQTRDGLVHISYTYDRVRIRHVVIDPAKLR